MNSTPAMVMRWSARNVRSCWTSGCSAVTSVRTLNAGGAPAISVPGTSQTAPAMVCGTSHASAGQRLEAAGARVHADGVDELAADELDARDEGLAGRQVLLQQGDAVDRGLELGAVDVGVELGERVEPPHAQALAALVVLRDERHVLPVGEGAGGVLERRRAEHGGGAGHVEPGLLQETVLGDLRHLELEHVAAAHDLAAGALEPAEDRPGVLLAVLVAAGVGARGHAAPVDAGCRLGREVDLPLGQQDLLDRDTLGLEGGGERREPLGVLVDDVHAGSAHAPTLGTVYRTCPSV
ncbi:hypothetical protein ACL00T_14115 [Curtobacterium flaccumfaciens]